MTGHSPGPWRTGRKVGRTIYDATDRLIGVMDGSVDARLAAGAPELLALVIRAAEMNCVWGAPYPEVGEACKGDDVCRTCVARALIRRIEGGP